MAEKVIGEVILRNVRLSFASLFEPQEQEQDDGTVRRTYKANFLIPKDDPEGNLKAIKRAADEAKEKKWGDKSKWPKLRPDKLCLRDGDLEDWDGYADHFYLSSNSPVARPPAVVMNRKGGNKKWLEAEPGQVYAGCYVNAVVRIWCQDNKHGKRINASLESVQFFRDGDAFGAAPVDPNDKFSDDMAGEEGSFGDTHDDDDDDSMI